jgi:hypothetical protein
MENTYIYPIFYIRYNTDEELNTKINILSAPLIGGADNVSQYNTSGYAVQFSPSDKIYPYMDDYSDFKQQVIECVNPMSIEQINKIVNDFINYGQDILYNKLLNVFCYFIGPNGEDLTKSVWNNSTKINRDNRRNIEASPITIKNIPQETYSAIENEYTNYNVYEYMPYELNDVQYLDIIDMIPEKINKDKIMIKETVEGAKYYCVFKIPIFSTEEDEKKDSVYKAKKLLKKMFKIEFNDKPESEGGDRYRQSIESDSGVNYQWIITTNPIDREKAISIADAALSYGTKSLILNLNDGNIQINIEVDILDSIADADITKRSHNLNKAISDISLHTDMNSLVSNVETFNSQMDQY